jgi:hypothetical protein
MPPIAIVLHVSPCDYTEYTKASSCLSESYP